METESKAKEAARMTVEESRNLREAAREAARRARAAGNQEVEDLIGDVEELIERLADTTDPAIARVRARVTDALRRTRRAVSSGAVEAQRQARNAWATGDNYVHEQPWEAIGAAALTGLVIGLLLLRR
jgi:ElaB/YqjD/DUF883 family membrane-anchored ribosome-binding protein